MRQAPVIHLRGLDSSIGLALVERILRTSAHLVVPREKFHEMSLRYATELEYGECEIHAADEVPFASGHRLMLIGLGPFDKPSDSDDGFEIDGLEVILTMPAHLGVEVDTEWLDSHIIVHDLLPRMKDLTWSTPLFGQWMAQLNAQEIPLVHGDTEHWWVSDIDVADAFVRILMSEEPFPSKMKVSGRRAWGQSQTIEELSLLHARTMAGKTGDFGIEHLTAAPTPSIEVQSLIVEPSTPMSRQENSQQRPDLSPIHDVLHRIDGDGWRPLVPIRTALMHSLVEYIE
ncbi:MAG: hypothetical protein HOL22_02075 [Euryarchaeota archaeon]|jgi:hypothetical protein|nr:hypothetical protein [Euryarchaeota archaeon]MBT5593941.1 hypothetical protein [Euryarchaeota archaeon]MBT6640632.1 hypothetical protein [Euryarchaeota archaeon]MBT6845090.1 hypothetical protein [Euryarchaeota archaeon]